MECCFCGDMLEYEIDKDDFPVCKKKECVKKLVGFCGSFCHSIDEELGVDTEGFIFAGKIIRYGHFEEDFNKIWEFLVKEGKI